MELSEQQKDKVLAEWNKTPGNPPPLLDLIRAAFPDQNVDGRSKEGRAVKAYLASRKLKARGAHEYQPKEKIELTEDQKEFVRNNAGMMTSNEIARVVFVNEELMPLSQESRTVAEYLQTLGPDVQIYNNPSDPSTGEKYKPPTTFNLTISRINKYVSPELPKDKLTGHQKKSIEALTGYLNTYRFIFQIESYRSQTDRDLFESSFVRYTNDKPDLSQEEVDQYIVLSCEVVISANIQRRVERLQQLLDNSAEDTEGRRIAMALVEAISSAQTEYNQCVNRQQKLLESLKEKRSDKLKKQIKENASVLNLVQMWKDEESRQKLIQLAEKRKQIVKEEKENLDSMDEFKAKIMGLSEDEL